MVYKIVLNAARESKNDMAAQSKPVPVHPFKKKFQTCFAKFRNTR